MTLVWQLGCPLLSGYGRARASAVKCRTTGTAGRSKGENLPLIHAWRAVSLQVSPQEPQSSVQMSSDLGERSVSLSFRFIFVSTKHVSGGGDL